jgi:hypothetical protein
MNVGILKAMLVDFVGDRVTIDAARLLTIINMSRDRLQRNHDLSFAKKLISATYPATASAGYALPTDFKGFPSAKSISLLDTGTSIYLPIYGITVTQFENTPALVENAETSFYTYRIEVLTTGPYLFIHPEPLGQSIKIRYNCWLTAITANDDSFEDFLLLRGYDAIFFECLKVVNLFLRNEERIVIDEPASARAIQELKDYVVTLEQSGASIGGY